MQSNRKKLFLIAIIYCQWVIIKIKLIQKPVSYTHLDVYKRQILIPILYDNLKEDYETGQFVATITSKPKYEFIYDSKGIFIKKRKTSN